MNGKAASPFRPPRERGTLRALALAMLMHVLLIALLFYGIHWQNNTPAGSEAELWSAVPDQPTPRPLPPPTSTPRLRAPPPARDEDAEIALRQRKRAAEQETQRQAQLAAQQRAQQLQQQQEAEAQRARELAARAAQQAAAQRQADLTQQQMAAQQKTREEARRAEQIHQAAHDKAAQAKAQQLAAAKLAEQQKAKARQAAQQQARQAAEQQRNAHLAALRGMAGGANSSGNGLATGGTGSGAGGTATSPGYAEKVQRRVRPNIVWAGESSASLTTVVAVRCSPDGNLLSSRVLRSSGNPQWDEAALRAVQKSDPMPVDTNGRAPASFLITLRPSAG